MQQIPVGYPLRGSARHRGRWDTYLGPG